MEGEPEPLGYALNTVRAGRQAIEGRLEPGQSQGAHRPQRPSRWVSAITLHFIAPGPVVDQLNITTSVGAFIGGTGVFAAATYPTAQIQLTTISVDSHLRLASNVVRPRW